MVCFPVLTLCTFTQATIPARQRELYVANLDPVAIVDDDDLARLFMPYGIVLSAKLAVDANGHSMGTGVVKMSTAAEADMARTRIQGRGELGPPIGSYAASHVLTRASIVMDSKRIAVTFSPPVSSPQSMQQPLVNHCFLFVPCAPSADVVFRSTYSHLELYRPQLRSLPLHHMTLELLFQTRTCRLSTHTRH